MHSVDIRRTKRLNTSAYSSGPILYWMSRDQRIKDNWALSYAQELARQHKTYVVIVFCIRPSFDFASERLIDFMFTGLRETEHIASTYHIPFIVIFGDPLIEISRYIHEHQIGAIICDMNPLRWSRSWKESLSKSLHIPFWEVDAHNIVPVWEASTKQEYAAYTIRPKIHAKLTEFLTEYPQVLKQSDVTIQFPHTDWISLSKSIQKSHRVLKVKGIQSGSSHGTSIMKAFISNKLKSYEKLKNSLIQTGQSQLSPYLHFGQLSSQRIALSVRDEDPESSYSSSFLEELIIRKELSDNFCWYNESYDSINGFPSWAKKTLDEHEKDTRDYTYTLDKFEHAQTHDVLWNAAQTELLLTGKMHGYLRMYWAKKILEWTQSPQDAMNIAIFLNDLYSLDGRDPNGYAGIAWSIGGVHDRPWFNRPIFGMVRYMSDRSIRNHKR